MIPLPLIEEFVARPLYGCWEVEPLEGERDGNSPRCRHALKGRRPHTLITLSHEEETRGKLSACPVVTSAGQSRAGRERKGSGRATEKASKGLRGGRY
jgi:hypothetical protein